MGDVRHERELREQWEDLHLDVHKQEGIERDKAATFISQKLGEMNEVRTQINTERGVYATREYVDAVFSSIDTRLKALENSKSYLVGWVAAIGMATAFVIYALKR